MKRKVFLMMILALCATWCLSQFASADVIVSVDRTNGTSGNRTHIGAFDGNTDPSLDQPSAPSPSRLLNDGRYSFSDRDYLWENTPVDMQNSEYVQTFNTDKGDNGDVNYAVTLGGNAVFWITMDDRFGNQQTLVNQVVAGFAAAGTFTDSGIDLTIGEGGGRPMSVFMSSEVSPPGTYNFAYSTGGNNYYTIGAFDSGANSPPRADAGADQRTTFTSPSTLVSLSATVQDDGNPLPTNPAAPAPNDPNKLRYYWTMKSGPTAVSFSVVSGEQFTYDTPNVDIAADTDVTFTQAGTYVLALNVSDQGPTNPGSDPCDMVTVAVYPEGKSNLVAYYNFDEGSGDVLQDTSGGVYEPNAVTGGFDIYTHDLDIVSGPLADPNWLAGPTGIAMVGANTFGTSLYFDPDLHQAALKDIVVPENDDDWLNGFTEATIMMWIKSSIIDTDRGFIIFDTPANNDQRGFRYDTTGGDTGRDDVLKGGFSGPSSANELETSESLQTTEWQHVAVTWKMGEEFKWFINGAQDTGQDSKSPLNVPLARYAKLIIGRGGKDHAGGGGVGPNFGWRGQIDDVKIFDKSLSQAEVQTEAGITDGAPIITVMPPDQKLIQETNGDTLALDATIADIVGDNVITWSQLSGPGTVAFSPNPNVEDVTVDFTGQPFGLYQLQLYVEDFDNSAWNDTATIYIMYQEKATYDLMGHWKLDESVGSTAFDSSGYDLDGTLVGDPNLAFWQPAGGKINGALQFINSGENNNQAVDLSVVPGSDDITIMFWMNADSESKGKMIDKLPDGTSGTGFTIYKRNGATRRIQFRVGSDDNNTNTNTDQAYVPGEWVHVACTFDSAATTAKVFINGLNEAERNDVAETINNISTPLYFGMTSNTADPTARFQGLLDHVRIYDRALSEFEVAQVAIQDMVEMVGCQPGRFPEQVIAGDISGPAGVPDCTIDIFDYSAMALEWLGCTDLNNPSCW